MSLMSFAIDEARRTMMKNYGGVGALIVKGDEVVSVSSNAGSSR